MKKITRFLLCLTAGILFHACAEDLIDQTRTDFEIPEEISEIIESTDTPAIPEDRETVLRDCIASLQERINFADKNIIATYVVSDADRCADDPNFKGSSFWWPEDLNRILLEEFYTNDEEYPLTFTEYDDGTALIVGVSNAFQAECNVLSYVWVKNKRNFEEWTAVGGAFKDEGCSGAVGEALNYYVIDQENSYMVSLGSDCLGEGIYGFEQRPNPDNPTTDNFGVAVGPGGALWDSSVGDLGLAGWAWITDLATGERLWESDFNFTFEKEITSGGGGGTLDEPCNVSDANRCDEDNPGTNFWWPEDVNAIDMDEFFETDQSTSYTFTEFADGTAHIVGNVVNINDELSCAVEVDVWLKDRKNWVEWQAIGGEFKDEGCSEANPENLKYYIVDDTRSTIKSTGSDCLGERTYNVSQRPRPSNPATPNFGVAVGPGGSLWDDRPDQNGLAGWIFITCAETGEEWGADFNFAIDCDN